MPELFPATFTTDPVAEPDHTQISFGSSWQFDFATGEFILSPNGKMATSQNINSWVEWCKKALCTSRYRHLVYSRNYGHEFEDLIGLGLPKEAIESEIQRMAVECLMADTRTASVKNFSFTWDDGAVFFTCEISNILGESATINGSVVTG